MDLLTINFNYNSSNDNNCYNINNNLLLSQSVHSVVGDGDDDLVVVIDDDVLGVKIGEFMGTYSGPVDDGGDKVVVVALNVMEVGINIVGGDGSITG